MPSMFTTCHSSLILTHSASQRSEDTPHPVNNILAVTPSSASTILILGRSKDLGMCMVVKRDGKVCGSWCDKRVSDACEFHVQTAVERRRASRPEFSAGFVASALYTFPRTDESDQDVRDVSVSSFQTKTCIRPRSTMGSCTRC